MTSVETCQIFNVNSCLKGLWSMKKKLQCKYFIQEKFTVKPEMSAAEKNGSSEIPMTTKCDKGKTMINSLSKMYTCTNMHRMYYKF